MPGRGHYPLTPEDMMELHDIPLHRIDRDPTYQVRQHWDPATDPTLAALAESLAGPEGLIHPIVVVQRSTPTTFGRTLTLIAGFRRVAAAQRLGWRTILARVLPPCDLNAPATRLRLLAIALRENTERQDLRPEERRVAVQRLRALYAEVYGGRPPATPGDPSVGFTPWAAQLLGVAARTIRQDLRLTGLGSGGVPLGRVLPAPVAPDAPAPLRVAYVLRTGHTLAAALEELTAVLTPDLPLAPPQRATLQQALSQLHHHLTRLQAMWAGDERPTDAPERGTP
jgi:hypothetical protein